MAGFARHLSVRGIEWCCQFVDPEPQSGTKGGNATNSAYETRMRPV